MKESYGEGLATHTGLKSCGDVREGGAEASTEVRAGQVFSRERTLLRGADAVGISGRPHLERRHRKTFLDPARSETLCTLEYTMPGNREVLELSAGDGPADRIGKPKGVRR
jgi:RNA-directed DNA polymerase